MRKRSKGSLYILLFLIVLGISVGYAVLTSNLKINGNSKVSSANWDIHWENVQINENSVPTSDENKARITDVARTEVEYSVVLSEPGDFYEFTVDAKNDGTIDAMIDDDGIVNGIYTDSTYETKLTTIPKTLNYTVTYADGNKIEENHLLEKSKKETYKVRVEYNEDINPSDLNENDQTFYFKFSVRYVQADNSKINRKIAPFTLKSGVDGETLGDELCLETECFYVVSDNSSEKVLLSKYNLNVGVNKDTSKTIGIQDPSTVGKVGVEAHSDAFAIVTNTESGVDGYWVGDNYSLLDKYNTYGESVSFVTTNLIHYEKDSDGTQVYPYVYDENSNLYSYVEDYVIRLKSLGAKKISGRLLKTEEAIGILGCGDYNKSHGSTCPTTGSTGFVSSTSYWLGNATNPSALSMVHFSGYFGMCTLNDTNSFGIRPVIVIKK